MVRSYSPGLGPDGQCEGAKGGDPVCPAGLSHATGHAVRPEMGAQQQGRGWAEHLDEPPVNPRPAARGKVGAEFRGAVWAGERGAIGTHAKQKRPKELSRPRGGSGREKGKGPGQTPSIRKEHMPEDAGHRDQLEREGGNRGVVQGRGAHGPGSMGIA